MSGFRELKKMKKKRPSVLKPDKKRQDDLLYKLSSEHPPRVQFLSGTQTFFFCVLLSTQIT